MPLFQPVDIPVPHSLLLHLRIQPTCWPLLYQNPLQRCSGSLSPLAGRRDLPISSPPLVPSCCPTTAILMYLAVWLLPLPPRLCIKGIYPGQLVWIHFLLIHFPPALHRVGDGSQWPMNEFIGLLWPDDLLQYNFVIYNFHFSSPFCFLAWNLRSPSMSGNANSSAQSPC